MCWKRQEKGTLDPFSTAWCPRQVTMPQIWDSVLPRKWETAFSSMTPSFSGLPCPSSSEELRFGTLVPSFLVESPAA